MSKISVIVPVYKVEKYIHRCVDSILGQTYADFELILVDDGSPDGCPGICDEYAEKDSRVVVIHQKNGGLSAARNAGIDWAFANSDSQWLTFIDSDDWVHQEYLSMLLRCAIEYNVYISACCYEKTNGEEPTVCFREKDARVWQTEEFYVECTLVATIACGKLYRRDCFQAIRYPVGKIHEDEFTTYRILFACSSIAVIELPLYFYYDNSNSITTSLWTPQHMVAIEAFDNQLSFFAHKGYYAAFKRRIQAFLWMLCSQYFNAIEFGERYQRDIIVLRKKMKEILRKYRPHINRSWPEYRMVVEIIYPRLSRLLLRKL